MNKKEGTNLCQWDYSCYQKEDLNRYFASVMKERSCLNGDIAPVHEGKKSLVCLICKKIFASGKSRE